MLRQTTARLQLTRSLLWRIFAVNASLFAFAWGFLAFTPASIKPPVVVAGLLGLLGLLLVVALNLLLLRRALDPLARLSGVARSFDPLRPGLRIPIFARDAEIVELTGAFNDMLERLEAERRDSARRALEAQEDERARIARELHDEIGQSLTAVLLGIEHVMRSASPEIKDALAPVRETARASLEEARGIAQRLRPEALDDLGLRSAMMHLTERVAAGTSIRVKRALDAKLPGLAPEKELVIYRVAQEALTNVLRHADATEVNVSLKAVNGSAVLIVSDDGCGITRAEGGGIKGMRERAILVGADLDIGAGRDGGLEVRLSVAGDRE